MTASDPRVGEIQAPAFEAAAKALRDAYAKEVCELPVASFLGDARIALEAAAPYMHAYLLAELRDREEKLARVELACDAMDAGVAMRAGDPRTKSHAATAIRAVIREPRAAVAAANGGES